MKVAYDATALMKCAQFIWVHNPSALDWGSSFIELGERILNEARQQAKQNAKRLREAKTLREIGHLSDDGDNGWISSISSGGYHILFTHEGDTIHLEFLVDPSVGLDFSQRNRVLEHI